MTIDIWTPSLNQYVIIAAISTNTDPTAITWIQGVLNNTPAWTPGAMENYFVPTPDQYQVYMAGDIVWANLTTSYNITLPDALGGNFTLPPMTLMFVPIGEGFAHEETTYLAPPMSGWTIMSSHTDFPAWVRVQIPMWLGSTPVETVGTIMLDDTSIYMPPTT